MFKFLKKIKDTITSQKYYIQETKSGYLLKSDTFFGTYALGSFFKATIEIDNISLEELKEVSKYFYFEGTNTHITITGIICKT